MTRTCANPACQVTFEPVSSWSPKRFCCYDCAHDARRGTTHAPWTRGTSFELANRITTLLRTDPHAWDRFRRLMTGAGRA